MNHLVIRKIFIFSLIFISGCERTSPKSETVSKPINVSSSSVDSGECPQQPEVVLNSQSVKAIALYKQVTLSGIARKKSVFRIYF
ncbi:MAG: hypothetical protein QNJ32_02250 [Xenococcaceae cyanobacterium MO_167.B27]|nr:hypothetical protein [Xenococcaceae cyanobacterium MO_167.B27]